MLGGLTAVQGKNAQVTFEKGCTINEPLVQLRITIQVRRGPWHTRRSDILGYDARPFLQMHKERSRRPNHQAEDLIRRCVDCWGKTRNIQESNVHQRTSKRRTAKLGRSNEKRSRYSVNHAEFQQSRQSREQIHSGRLKIKQSAAVATLVKQDPEYHLAAGIVREREQEQRIAGSSSMQEERQARPFSSSSSQWDAWWTSSWWDKSRKWKE